MMKNLLGILILFQFLFVPFAMEGQSYWQFKEKTIVPIYNKKIAGSSSKSRSVAKVQQAETQMEAATASSCPPNIDFEKGDFSNWKCYTGYAGINSWTLSGPVATRHEIISKTSFPTTDSYGGFPCLCPSGGQYSVKLGNSNVNSEAEKISYTYTIPSTQNNFMLTYYYAVVFEDPGHSFSEQPRFKAQVYDVSNGSAPISCASFDYTAGSGLPGFYTSAASYYSTVLYKPWTPVTINLSGYAGHTILLEFTTQDCTQGGHFGYAYIDVSSDCSTLVSGASYCSNAKTLTLTAPSSYQNYTWWDKSFKNKLGTGQTLNLSPPPADNTQINVDLIPYSGFGCRDTAATVISVNPCPVAAFKTDKTTASFGNPIQFTNQSTINGNTALNCKWDFGDGTSATTTNVSKAYKKAGLYNVKMVVTSGAGCQDSVNHSIKITALSPIQGVTTLCQGTTAQLTDTMSGGVWKSLDPKIATIDAKGFVTGVTGGKATIRYVFTQSSFADSVSTVITVRPTSASTTKQTLCSSELPIVWNGMPINKEGTFVAHLTNVVGCDSVATLNLIVHPVKTTNLSDTIVQNKTYTKYGYSLPLQTKYGDFTFYQHQKTMYGCDSTVVLNLRVSPDFSAKMRTSPRICADEKDFTLSYDIDYGNIEQHSVVFDDKAKDEGFVDIIKQTANGSYIDVPLPLDVLPATYKASVVFDNGPVTKVLPISFTVNYPSSVILQKWNDVLALYNSNHNGGYAFTDYQWYKNGEVIDGATKSYLYLPNEKLDTKSEYTVKITRANDGVSLFTCPVIPTLHTDIAVYPTLMSKASHVTIKMDGTGTARLLNISGLPIKEQTLHAGENILDAPNATGTYLLLISNEKGEIRKQLLIVK